MVFTISSAIIFEHLTHKRAMKNAFVSINEAFRAVNADDVSDYSPGRYYNGIYLCIFK